MVARMLSVGVVIKKMGGHRLDCKCAITMRCVCDIMRRVSHETREQVSQTT